MCSDVNIKVVKCDKWLGDYLHSDGLPESVTETIRQREGKVKGAALGIVEIVDDWRARTVHNRLVSAIQCGKLAEHIKGSGEALRYTTKLVSSYSSSQGPGSAILLHALGVLGAQYGSVSLAGETRPRPAHLPAWRGRQKYSLPNW